MSLCYNGGAFDGTNLQNELESTHERLWGLQIVQVTMSSQLLEKATYAFKVVKNKQ